MSLLVTIIIGGIVGWLASILMKTDGQQGLLMNVVVGIVGAFIGGFLMNSMTGSDTINQQNFSLTSLVVSFLGAVVLLAVVRLLRGATSRA